MSILTSSCTLKYRYIGTIGRCIKLLCNEIPTGDVRKLWEAFYKDGGWGRGALITKIVLSIYIDGPTTAGNLKNKFSWYVNPLIIFLAIQFNV